MDLIDDVKHELKFIERLEEDMEKHNYLESYLVSLDRWLGKKFYTK